MNLMIAGAHRHRWQPTACNRQFGGLGIENITERIESLFAVFTKYTRIFGIEQSWRIIQFAAPRKRAQGNLKFTALFLSLIF